jgi:hypothetical protein
LNLYFYLVSSLPFLDYDDDPPFTISGFLESCAGCCSKSNFFLLENASLFPRVEITGRNTLLSRFYSWEISLRNELARLRAKKKGYGPEKYIREQSRSLISGEIAPQQTARAVYQQESPLLAEETILRARWVFLDELEADHHFDLEKLIVYKLKLEILVQKSHMKQEKGEEKFKSITDYFEKQVTA